MPRRNRPEESASARYGDIQPLTSSLRDRWHNCPKLFWWSVDQCWQPKRSTAPLIRGSMFHAFTEALTNGKKAADAWKVADGFFLTHMKEAEQYYHADELSKINAARSLVKGMCLGLADHLKVKNTKIVAAEYTMAARIPGLSGGDFSVYVGTADAILESKDGLWVLDYKTKSQVHNSIFEWLPMDNQTVGYSWLLRKEIAEKRFPSKKPVKGVIWMAALITKIKQKQHQTYSQYLDELETIYASDPEKFLRKFTINIEDDMVDEWATELAFDARDIRAHVERGDVWPKNTKNCLNYGSVCGYLTLCRNGFTRSNKGQFVKRKPNYWDRKADLMDELGVD